MHGCIFYILARKVPLFLYAYHAYVMIYCRSCISGSWSILFKLLTLDIAISIVLLYLSNILFLSEF